MGERIDVVLACSVCNGRNYRTTRVKRPGAPQLALKKYCPKCKCHTVHKETK